MKFFRTRKPRISVDFTAKVCFQDKRSGTLSDSSLPCTVSSISGDGACLILEKMVLEGRHLFFNAQKQSEQFLYVQDFSIDLEIEEPKLQAVAIWMDSCTEQEKKVFKVGIQFIENQNDLVKTLETATKGNK